MPSFRDRQFMEPPRARVVITQVDNATLTATGVARGNNVAYIIDLTTAVGANWVIPKVGEEWLITRVANAWALERRGMLQSPGAASLSTAQNGTTVVEGGLNVTGGIFRHIGPGEPDTTGWSANDFWYDTSTETAGAGTLRRWDGSGFVPSV